MRKLVVFDLDGTLVDTLPDIAAAVNHALAKLGMPEVTEHVVRSGIGDGAEQLVMRCLPEDIAEYGHATGDGIGLPQRVLSAFLAHYTDNCTHLTRPFPGVREALEALAGIPLAVLTNKPLAATLRILEELRLAAFFTQVLGGDNPWGKKPDPGALRHIRQQIGASSRNTVLVGDGWQDFKVAQNDEVGFVLFKEGYGSEAGEFQDYSPAFSHFSELPELIGRHAF